MYFDLIHFYTAITAPLCSEDKEGSNSVAGVFVSVAIGEYTTLLPV